MLREILALFHALFVYLFGSCTFILHVIFEVLKFWWNLTYTTAWIFVMAMKVTTVGLSSLIIKVILTTMKSITNSIRVSMKMARSVFRKTGQYLSKVVSYFRPSKKAEVKPAAKGRRSRRRRSTRRRSSRRRSSRGRSSRGRSENQRLDPEPIAGPSSGEEGSPVPKPWWARPRYNYGDSDSD